jgi:glycosyltransferase involved in cell wall biosynthesis
MKRYEPYGITLILAFNKRLQGREMARSLRIAQIGSRGIPGHRGGVEQVIEAIAPRLVGLGHRIVVYCANWSTYSDDTFKGVQLRYVYSIRSKYLDTFVRSFLSLLRELVDSSDIVHFHSIGSAPLALLARAFGKKVVVTIHGMDWQRRKWSRLGQWFLRLGEWTAIRVPHRTVVVGMELKRILDARYRTNVVYIPNGVEDRPKRQPRKILSLGINSRKYILYLARLVPEKQCHVLIEAFSKLPNRHEFKLVIAGPAWHSDEYVASLHRLAGDDPSILFTGEVDDETLEELYANCYAYVLPSEVEGMSLSLLDAMAFGACIIASDIPANADVVGDSGVVFATGDSISLMHRLEELILSPDKAEALRLAARGRMTSEFHWDKIARQWEHLYLSIA